MIELVESICKRLAVPFGKGGQLEFEKATAKVDRAAVVPLVFMQVYEDTVFTSTSAGAVLDTVPFELNIVLPSAIEEPVEYRLPKIQTCTDVARNIYRLLIDVGSIPQSSARCTPMLSATSSIMAGVRFSGTYSGDYQDKCID